MGGGSLTGAWLSSGAIDVVIIAGLLAASHSHLLRAHFFPAIARLRINKLLR